MKQKEFTFHLRVAGLPVSSFSSTVHLSGRSPLQRYHGSHDGLNLERDPTLHSPRFSGSGRRDLHNRSHYHRSLFFRRQQGISPRYFPVLHGRGPAPGPFSRYLRVIGFLNSARFVGNAIGPMLATSVFAFSSLPVLYFLISGTTFLALCGFRRFLR